MKEKKLWIRKPDDFHVHFRRDEILALVAKFTSLQFNRAIAMPNTSSPILNAEQALRYREQIIAHTHDGFEPLMTIQITDRTTPAMIVEAKKAGVVAGKIYPQGVTTNSQNGVTNFNRLRPVFRKMQQVDMVLSLHGQLPGDVYYLDREEKFLPILISIAKLFPRLRIVMEHLSTRMALGTVLHLNSHGSNNVAATITAHHMILTGNDFADGCMQPHNFCIPPAQRPEDRYELINAATSGNPNFFFGSDSAPHLRTGKECPKGKGGIFSSPIALPLLAQIFEGKCQLPRLENFVSEFGAHFYGLPHNTAAIELVGHKWTVPNEYNGIVPFMAGQTLHWQVAK